MKIEELVCKPDGVQELTQREVPDDFFDISATQITQLKFQLSESDYKVIKCAECQLAGLELPYDILSLNAERQAIRDQIKALEG